MNYSEVIKQVLMEQEPSKVAKGVDFNDTGTLLNNAIQYCKGIDFLKGRPIKAMTKTNPKDATGQPLMAKFPDVYKSGKENIAFATGDGGGGNIIVVFGMQDPNITENSLLGYRVTAGNVADRIVGGIAKGCQYVQTVQDVGQSQLSAYDKAKLDDFMKMQGGLYVTTDPKDALNYREYKMKDLKDMDGKPLLQNPGEGIVWKKVSAGKQEMGDIAGETNQYMVGNGFTLKKPPVGSDQAELGFYLKDVAPDVKAMGLDVDMRTNQIYYPDPNYISEYGTSVLEPDKKTCKEVINKLHGCKNGKINVGCKTNLIRDKFIALSCRTKNFIDGPLGRGDEFKELLADRITEFGLRNLEMARGKAKYASVTESLEKRINKRLNEDFKRLSFTQKKYEFDPILIESLADKLVLSALFDLQKDMIKVARLNEDTLAQQAIGKVGDVASSAASGIGNFVSNLGDGLGDKLWQAGKETVAKEIISWAGFDPKSYMSLLLVNVFANLDVKDYGNFIKDCEKFSAIITKSALEAWLDKAAQSMGTGDGGITTFVYSALKNTVTETAANTEPFRRLEGLAGKIVCSLIDGVRESGIFGDFDFLR